MHFTVFPKSAHVVLKKGFGKRSGHIQKSLAASYKTTRLPAQLQKGEN